MPLRINFNYEATNAQRNLASTQGAFFKAVQNLSSGLRINTAADDTAGLSISEKLKNQVRGLNQASRNTQDAISLMMTAEGAMNEQHDILARFRELAVQSANDTLTDTDRVQIQAEANQLTSELNRIASNTQFNTKNLLDGTYSGGGATCLLVFHIGANSGQEFTLSIANVSASALNVTDLSVCSQTGANIALSNLDIAIQTLSAYRGKLGAIINRFEHTIAQLGVASENTAAANSRIRDADVAASTAEMVRTQILQQAAMAVLAQANQAPQAALALLR